MTFNLSFLRFYQSVEKLLFFFVNFTCRQTVAERKEIDPWSYDDFGFSLPKEHIHNGLVKEFVNTLYTLICCTVITIDFKQKSGPNWS
jgi:hypothetical protein